MYCIRCGHKNLDDAHFCALCGHKLGSVDQSDDTTISMIVEITAEDESLRAVDSLTPGQALLLIQRGSGAGSSFLLDKPIVSAGRNPSSDIFLDDVTVSRHHVDILRESHRFIAKDAGSLNGTYVNRERVDVAELENGDELQIGRFKLVFYSGPRERA
ncbi:MAG: FHA domain-containing protein [Actinomycetota bacterium]